MIKSLDFLEKFLDCLLFNMIALGAVIDLLAVV
jgi:hypothetical protein